MKFNIKIYQKSSLNINLL